MRARAIPLFILGLGLVFAGCVESTWTYTLNPDGSGKVKLEALLQPPLDFFDRGRDLFEDEPDALAKKVAGNILAKSKGVAAWKDVSSGIADDGRVLFKGTAYFDDLAKVDIKGDPFPTSFLKPKLSKEDDGRLVLGLDVGDIGEKSAADEGEREDHAGENETPGEPREEEVALGVKKGKVAYQTIKPIATAFLSTMRTEIVVCIPGEAEEISNFKRDEDGALRLVFDGQRLLGVLDDLARKDAAKWYEFAVKMKDRERPDEEVVCHLNELVFGEREPVRAVVAGEVKPLFDYERELAEARSDHERFAEGRGLDAADASAGLADFWGLSGGVLASARTDSGTGVGWTAVLSGGDRGGPSSGQLEVSHATYEDDPSHREMTRIAFNFGDSSEWDRVAGGLALSFGEGDIWAFGPQLLYGVGFFGRHAELHLTATVYLWLGERDDEFDVDVEADVRLVAGMRF